MRPFRCVAASLTLVVLSGCGPSPAEVASQVDSMRPAVPRRPAAPRPVASPAPSPAPPPTGAETRGARARAGLPPGGSATILDPGGASPYVLAVRRKGEGDGATMLAVLDVRTDPAILLGRHDFMAGPVSVGEPLSLSSARGDPVLLAGLETPHERTTCGWWLSPGRPRFVCAPKIAGASRYEVRESALVESWATPFPPASVVKPTRTGRVLRLSSAGRWSEIDGFRCLGRSLEDALDETSLGNLRRWQKDSIRRLTRVARHQSRAFEDDRATGLLRDAIEIDACDAEPWRILGRLEFQRGNPPEAVPALAVSVALDSHEAAPLVDLGDALVPLDVSKPDGERAWRTTKEILARPVGLRELAESAGSPSALARALYHLYLERTEATADLHRATRRRVQEQLRLLPRSSPRASRSGSAAPVV